MVETELNRLRSENKDQFTAIGNLQGSLHVTDDRIDVMEMGY